MLGDPYEGGSRLFTDEMRRVLMCVRFAWWHRIMPLATPRLATTDSLQTEPAATKDAMRFDGF